MVEESSPLLPPAEESIEAEPDTTLEPKPESDEPTLEPTGEPDFVCACEQWMRSACEGLPFYKEQESQRYCVLHYPGKEKSDDFKAALDSKLNKKDFDFRGVWFPDNVNFRRVRFSEAALFHSATFSAGASFSHTRFSANADFSNSSFSAGADFSHAIFSEGAYFSHAAFGAGSDFRSATFCAGAFFEAAFTGDAYFRSATFGAYAYFSHAMFSAAADFLLTEFNAAADFSYAIFKAGAVFNHATFKADAGFSHGTFSEAVYFGSATFSAGARFSHAGFSAACFHSATFSAYADFNHASFNAHADFSNARFSFYADFSFAMFSAEVHFSKTIFDRSANFRRACFSDSLSFFGSAAERYLSEETTLGPRAVGINPELDFQHARIEKPERVAFHTMALRPHWFVNVDAHKFVFTDVDWQWNVLSVDREIDALTISSIKEDFLSPAPTTWSLLRKACRQLAENAAMNNRYEEASRFRYFAMDLARRAKWKRWSFWKTDWLHLLYWAVSGYGERILRALGVLAAVWIVFVMLYTRVGFVQQPASNQAAASATAASTTIEDKIGQPLEFTRALTYSFAVMSLQKPEPKPLTGAAQTLVLLETILGPVQAALLALAIRRKFMR